VCLVLGILNLVLESRWGNKNAEKSVSSRVEASADKSVNLADEKENRALESNENASHSTDKNRGVTDSAKGVISTGPNPFTREKKTWSQLPVATMARLQKYASTPAVVADAGGVRNFRLAMDELYVRDPETGKGKGVTVASASDLATLMAQMEKVQTDTGFVPELVMYEDGVERNEFTRRVVTRELMLESASQAAADQAAKSAGLVFRDAPAYAPGKFLYLAESSPEALAAWTQLEEQKIVSSSLLLARQQSKRALPNDPYVSKQWHLKFANQSGAVVGTDVNIDTVWSYPNAEAGQRGRGIYVGIVDDGLQTAHPDLAANVDTTIDKDWNGNDLDPNPEGTGDTGDNHGTACAGNVAAVGNNGVGVSGTAPEAKLVGMRLISAAAGDAAEAEAMTYHSTVGQIIHILSNSWGPNDDGLTLEGPGTLTVAALKSAVETGRNGKGTIITWAAGNGGDVTDNSNYDGYANSIYTIAVGAFDSQSNQAYYSEPGANLVISAPSNGASPALGITTVDRSGAVGYNTGSTSGEIPDANYTQTFGGTSSATPTLSGIIALILEANPKLGWRDVQEIIMRSAKKVNPTDTDWKTPVAPDNINHNHKFGAGLIDATAAVNMAKTWVNLGAQQSVVSTTPASFSVSIPDNNATGATKSFDFSASNLRVEHVTVKVSIGTVPKGQIEVTLTSPSGTVSRLAEKNSDSTNRYTGWTFMTVRNWGENSRGTWTLKVADRSAGTVGTLTAAEVTIYGTGNPPPSVTVTQPASVASGTNVTLTATASDFTADGSTGVVSSVQFFQGATPLGIATQNSGSYTFNWNNPLVGNYSITAQATDSEGAVGVSAPVLFTVLSGNGSPVISSLSTTSASVGSSVVLTGSNFVDVSGVAFSGTPAASFTVDSATQITAVVPSGAATGFISVTNGFGSGTSSSAFTVTQLPVLISQIYGAGGNTGATYNSDYVEIYNRSASPVNLSGWSVQYASSTGISWSSAALSGTIGAGKYFLLKLAGGTIGAALPTPDFTTTSINMSGTSGKVALMNSTTALTGSSPLGVSGLQDFVGYGTANAYEGSGPAPGGSSTLAVLRQGGGLTDTGNNVADFSTEAPNPRNSNSGSVLPPVISSSSLTAPGTVGIEFSYQIAASGSPTSYAATGLPAGLSVSTSTGAITGKPTVAATSNVTISATNASGTGSATLVITISSSGGGGGGGTGTNGVLLGWNMSGQTNYGTSPLIPTVYATNYINVGSLTRSTGVSTSTNGATLNGWGGIGWTNTNCFASFTVSVPNGYKLSLSNIPTLDYKRSKTGPNNGVLQYSTNGMVFQAITNLSYTNTNSSGVGSLGPISLSGITQLQNISSGTTVTFQIVNTNGASTGTWYIYDKAVSTANDFEISGSVDPIAIAGPTFAGWAGEGVAITPELLMKYAIGGAANSSATGETPVVSMDGSNLTLTAIVRKDSSLTIEGQAVTNLEAYGTQSWTPITGTLVGVSQDGVPTDCERKIFKSTLTGSKSFLRLSVQKQ